MSEPNEAADQPPRAATSPAVEQLLSLVDQPPLSEIKRFICRHPNETFEGHQHGVKFTDGWATTDNPNFAYDMVQNGFAVFDSLANRLAFGGDVPDSAERILAVRKERQAAAQS